MSPRTLIYLNNVQLIQTFLIYCVLMLITTFDQTSFAWFLIKAAFFKTKIQYNFNIV